LKERYAKRQQLKKQKKLDKRQAQKISAKGKVKMARTVNL